MLPFTYMPFRFLPWDGSPSLQEHWTVLVRHSPLLSLGIDSAQILWIHAVPFFLLLAISVGPPFFFPRTCCDILSSLHSTFPVQIRHEVCVTCVIRAFLPSAFLVHSVILHAFVNSFPSWSNSFLEKQRYFIVFMVHLAASHGRNNVFTRTSYRSCSWPSFLTESNRSANAWSSDLRNGIAASVISSHVLAIFEIFFSFRLFCGFGSVISDKTGLWSDSFCQIFSGIQTRLSCTAQLGYRCCHRTSVPVLSTI